MDGCGRERGHLRMEHLRDVTQEKDPYANGYVLEERHQQIEARASMCIEEPIEVALQNARALSYLYVQ